VVPFDIEQYMRLMRVCQGPRRRPVSENVGEGLVPSRRNRCAAGAHEGLPYTPFNAKTRRSGETQRIESTLCVLARQEACLTTKGTKARHGGQQETVCISVFYVVFLSPLRLCALASLREKTSVSPRLSNAVGEGLVPSRREPTRGSPTLAGKMPTRPVIAKSPPGGRRSNLGLHAAINHEIAAPRLRGARNDDIIRTRR
jgi:hypothetical protein